MFLFLYFQVDMATKPLLQILQAVCFQGESLESKLKNFTRNLSTVVGRTEFLHLKTFRIGRRKSCLDSNLRMWIYITLKRKKGRTKIGRIEKPADPGILRQFLLIQFSVCVSEFRSESQALGSHPAEYTAPSGVAPCRSECLMNKARAQK